MTGRGSIRHNNRSFSAANVDRSRSGQNVTFCNEDLKKGYHELFDEALAAMTVAGGALIIGGSMYLTKLKHDKIAEMAKTRIREKKGET